MPDQNDPSDPSDPNITPLVTPTVWDEDRLTELFLQHNRKSFKYIPAQDKWFFWTGERWIEDGTLMIREAVKPICRAVRDTLRTKTDREKMGRTSLVSNIIKAASSAVATMPEDWDCHKMLLNTPTCVIDLATGRTQPHDRELLMAKSTTVSPEQRDCPQWKAFLTEITQNNDELIEYLQRVAGYALTGLTNEDKFWFFHGSGRNGKGTFIRVIAGILGDYHVAAPIETFLENRNDRHETELACLAGARLVTSGETKVGQRWNEGRLKILTGGDDIRARFMNSNYFTYRPQFKLVFGANKKPTLDVDEAISDRTNIVPFLRYFQPEERVPDLDKKLIAEEGPAILQWMIDGCVAWQQRRLNHRPACVDDATRSYMTNESIFITWISECCDTSDSTAHGVNSKLFASYKAWCASHNERAISARAWAAEMEALGYRRNDPRRGEAELNTGRWWHGITVAPEHDERDNWTPQADGRNDRRGPQWTY